MVSRFWVHGPLTLLLLRLMGGKAVQLGSMWLGNKAYLVDMRMRETERNKLRLNDPVTSKIPVNWHLLL